METGDARPKRVKAPKKKRNARIMQRKRAFRGKSKAGFILGTELRLSRITGSPRIADGGHLLKNREPAWVKGGLSYNSKEGKPASVARGGLAKAQSNVGL